MVQFDSGSFSRTGPQYSKLTEFVLDRTVDVVIGLQVSEIGDGFILGLQVRPIDGSPEIVLTSDSVTEAGGWLIPFSAIPAGIYNIVIQPLGSTVEGTFTASWENIDESESTEEEDVPVNLSPGTDSEESGTLTPDLSVPVVPAVRANDYAAG